MLINREETKQIGMLTLRTGGWSDIELKRMIKIQGLALAFLEGKGSRWWLAVSTLRRELDGLNDMARARGFGEVAACW